MHQSIRIRRGFRCAVGIGLLSLFAAGLPSIGRADEASARKLVEATRKLLIEAETDARAIQLGKLGQARKNLKLVDVELADVEGPAKTALEKDVKALTEKAASLAASGEVDESVKLVEDFVAAAKESLGNPDTLEDHLKQAETHLKKPAVRKALGDAKVATFTKQIAALRKASVAQQHDRGIEQMKESLDRLASSLPEALQEINSDSPASRDSAIRSFQGRDYQLVEKILEWMPADDAEAKPLIARFKKVDAQFSAAVAKVMGGEAADRLKRSWESYLNEFEGWENEKTAPTFAQMTKEQSQAMSALGAPKTVALASRANYWLKSSVDENEDLKPLLKDSRVKAVVDQVRGERDAAHKKLLGFAETILKEAEGAKLDQSSRDRLERFVDDDLRLALEDAPQLATLQERGHAAVARFDKAAGGTAAEKESRYEELVKKADADWPGMLSKYSPVEGFDPAEAAKFRGKVVAYTSVRNRLGWDYATDDYNFAMDINGSPVAGRFAPEIRKAVKQALEETGRDALPEESYDIVAVVGGPCKVKRRVQREGTVEMEGVKANVEAESWEPVDATLLNIVALHCGPVAVAVDADSSFGSAAGGGGGLFNRLFMLLLGLTAASLALIKSNFAPVVAVPQVGQMRMNVGDDNLGRIGVLLAVLGIYWMLRGYLFYGLLVSGTIAAAGIVAGADTLAALGILKPAALEKLRPFGVLIGLACAAAAILHLFTNGSLSVI